MRVLILEDPAGDQYELGHRIDFDDSGVPVDAWEAVALARRCLPDLRPASLVRCLRADRRTPSPGSREHILLIEEVATGLEPWGNLMLSRRTMPRPTLGTTEEPVDLRDLLVAEAVEDEEVQT